jgi:hypothetical protein
MGQTATGEEARVSARADEDQVEEFGWNSARAFLGKRWVYEAAYAVLVVGAAALILSLVGRRAGWPLGGAFFNELILVHLYAAHFRHLDFFPVWSSTDGLGLGTPVLLFYQKAFFYVSGVIFILLGGELKPTLILSVGIFLAIGAYGMRRALEMVTDNRLLQVVGSVGFLFTNYVFTDWLTRGDLPEFSAMMIVPWLLFWCLNLLKNRRVSLLLIPIVPLLVDAHSAIGLISLFTLAVTIITFVAIAGTRGLRAIGKRLVVAVGGASVLLAPTLLAELKFADYYDPAYKVTLAGQQVSNDFVGIGWYFYDGAFRWLDSKDHHYRLVQIDFAIWIPIVVTLIAAIIYWAISGRRPDRTAWGRSFHVPSMLFLLASLCIYISLQLRIFYFVYQILSPLQVIDYPYRMLAFITPLGVITVIAIANSIFRAYPSSVVPRVVAVLWLLSLILLSPITSSWIVPRVFATPPGQFANIALASPPSFINYRTFGGIFSTNGILYDEYLPKIYNSKGREVRNDGPLYHQLHDHQFGAASLSRTRCTISVPASSPLESLELTFTVKCAGPTRFALPVTFNAYSTVYVKGKGGTLRQIPYHRVYTDPRMVVRIPNAKSDVIVVHLPTLWGVLR